MFYLSKKEFKLTLPHNYLMHCLRFPGLWLPESELADLRKNIERVTLSELDTLPEYGVYLSSRDPYTNRIITLVYKRNETTPAAFAAMVHCRVHAGAKAHPVLHLGLIVKSGGTLRRNLLFLIYYYPLIYFFMLRGFRPCWITSVSMEPSIIGSVADNFGAVFPHYLGITQPTETMRRIARAFVSDHGHEFGIGPNASLDENRFVIQGSCRGPSEAIRASFDQSAKYKKDPRCNTYCEKTLNYERGDELLQIGRLRLNSVLAGSLCKVKTNWKRKHGK